MSRRGTLLFAAVSVIWGTPYLLIKLALDGGLTPLALAFGRVAIATLILLALAARAGTLRWLRGRLRWVAAYGVIEIALPLPLIAFGEQRISSSLAAIIIATVPLMVAALALRFSAAERPDRRRLAGLVAGFAGVALLVGIDASGRASTLLGAGAVLLAAAGYATGPMILAARLADLDPRATMGASLAVAALLLAPAAALDLPARIPTAGSFASLLALGVVCTALGFAAMAALVAEAGASRAVVVTYLNPLIAVALGVSLLGERPGSSALAGLALILAGARLATAGARTPTEPRQPRGQRSSRRLRSGEGQAGSTASGP